MKFRKLNENSTQSIIKVTGGKSDIKWTYDTMTDGMDISFSINGVPCKFRFRSCHGRYIVDGMDCDSIFFENDMYSKNVFRAGGGNRHYALYIPESVMKSSPKENQKDFGFTGRYYSTVPVVKYCKELLKTLFSDHLDYFIPNILDKLGITIPDESEIDESKSIKTFDAKAKNLHESSLVDKKMNTLGKAGKPIYLTSDQLKDAKTKYPDYDFEETDIGKSLPAGQKAYIAKRKELSESSSEWRFVDSKSVPDSDGFMTDYTWYQNTNDGRHVFIFGDNDLYDADSTTPDWETDSYKEAESWFYNYRGFEDELEESLAEAVTDFKLEDRVTDGEKIGTVYKQDKYGLVAVEWDGDIKLSWVDKKDLKLIESLNEASSHEADKIDAELLVGKSKDEIKRILEDAPIGSQIIHIRDKSNRFNIDKHIEKTVAYKSNYYQGIGSPHDFKNREVFWKVAGYEDPYIVTTIYDAVNGIDKYMSLTSEVLKSESGKTIKEDVAPFKNERFKKRLQDELYEAFIKLAKTPSWGSLNIKEIEDVISPVIEVNDYTGEYDVTHVVEFRGEVDYEELMEISDVLTKVIKQYDADAYFEPVTSGITRAYIKVRKNVIESKITNVKETKKEIAQKILQVESKQELWDLITQVAAFDLGLYNQLMDIADLDLPTNIKLNRISNKLLGNKQKNESLIADEEDGWGDEIERILEPVFRELEGLIYEVRKAVRGAHTNCNTPSELAQYIQKISEDLDDAANDIDSDADELLEAAEDEEPKDKISEFMFLKNIYKTFKSFKDRDSAEYLDFLDDLTNKEAKFDVYNHRKTNAVTVFYDPQEDLI